MPSVELELGDKCYEVDVDGDHEEVYLPNKAKVCWQSDKNFLVWDVVTIHTLRTEYILEYGYDRLESALHELLLEHYENEYDSRQDIE